MPIQVNCPKCSRGLKAPDALAGQRAKCPSCGTVVEVPLQEEEILDAELEDPHPPSGFDNPVGAGSMSSLLGEAAGYELANPRPAVGAAGPATEESRRPCPACGEMIVSTAAKCRFCGEVFDATLRRIQNRRGQSGGTGPLATRMSRLGAAILDGIIAIVLIGPGYAMIIASTRRNAHDNNAIGAVLLIVGLLVVAGLQFTLLATSGQSVGKKAAGIRIVKAMDGSNPGFVAAVLLRAIVPACIALLIPCFNLIDVLFIFGEERRCVHDHIAGTIVIEA